MKPKKKWVKFKILETVLLSEVGLMIEHDLAVLCLWRLEKARWTASAAMARMGRMQRAGSSKPVSGPDSHFGTSLSWSNLWIPEWEDATFVSVWLGVDAISAEHSRLLPHSGFFPSCDGTEN